MGTSTFRAFPPILPQRSPPAYLDIANVPSLRDEREEPHQFRTARLRAVFADLERLGVLHGLAGLVAEQLDELAAEPVGRVRIAVVHLFPREREPARLVLGHRVKVTEEPGVPLV